MRLALLLVALLGALAIPAAFLLTRGDGTRFRGSTAPAGFTLPAFALQDDEGRMVRSDELRGKAVAVTFLDAPSRRRSDSGEPGARPGGGVAVVLRRQV